MRWCQRLSITLIISNTFTAIVSPFTVLALNLPSLTHHGRVSSFYSCTRESNKCLQEGHDSSWKRRNINRISSLSLSRETASKRYNPNKSNKKKRIVIVGGGWAGFTAAESLSHNLNENDDVEILLLDASPRGKGGLAGGWRTEKTNRPVEAGIHGFWREYKNTFKVMEGIDGLDVDEVLGGYTPSVLISNRGRVALAPVLGNDGGSSTASSTKGSSTSISVPKASDIISAMRSGNVSPLLKPISTLLPPPLDVALLSEFAPNSSLNIIDRTSAIGLLGAWADFEQESPSSWKRYDSISAEDLFLKYAGITRNLYDELVSPLLHVLPMCPGYDCSAAAALSCFHVFALQSRGAFDVRWCRGGISEKIFDPWAAQLVKRGVNIRGSAKVTSIDQRSSSALLNGAVVGEESEKEEEFVIKLNLAEDEEIVCDSIILAVGGTSIGRLAASSPAIIQLEASKDFDKLRGVTCVAVRIFLEPNTVVTTGLKGGSYDKTELHPDIARAMADSPIMVCGAGVGGIPELKETGFCIYDLQRMHDEFAVDVSSQENKVSVLEVDFFRADDLADIEDDYQIANIALQAVATALDVPQIDDKKIVDLAVVRARKAVSHFAMNSASYSPGVKVKEGIYMCGDWIDRSGHASWSTEKAVVTGRQAAESLSDDLDLKFSMTDIIPAAPDTPQLSALRQVSKFLRRLKPPMNEASVPPSPWIFVKDALRQFSVTGSFQPLD